MDKEEIDNHLLRAIYELQLISDDYKYHKKDPDIRKFEKVNELIKLLSDIYPHIKWEIEKWK